MLRGRKKTDPVSLRGRKKHRLLRGRKKTDLVMLRGKEDRPSDVEGERRQTQLW